MSVENDAVIIDKLEKLQPHVERTNKCLTLIEDWANETAGVINNNAEHVNELDADIDDLVDWAEITSDNLEEIVKASHKHITATAMLAVLAQSQLGRIEKLETRIAELENA